MDRLQWEDVCGDLVEKGATVMREEFERMNSQDWEARFARFVQMAMQDSEEAEPECGEFRSAEEELEALYERRWMLEQEMQETGNRIIELQTEVDERQLQSSGSDLDGEEV